MEQLLDNFTSEVIGMAHFVYVLECGDGTYYTGYTTDLDDRIETHENGDGAKYTRGRGPFELVHQERFGTKSAAMTREHEIKALSRNQKIKLIKNPREE